MLDNKKMMLLCMMQYVVIIAYHIIYSLIYASYDQTLRITVWSVCVLLVLLLFSYMFQRQLDLVVYVIMASVLITVTYVGYLLNTLSYALVIYFSAGLILTMFLTERYIYVWGIGTIASLILNTVIWPDVIKKYVPSIMLYYGYILAYAIGFFYLIVLVNAAKRNFNQMQEAAIKAEAQNNSKNLFWANISNEIRTPMNVINGMSRLLKMENLNNRAQEYTEQIENASDMLINIVSDTMELSQLETDTYVIKNSAYDLYRLIHTSIMEVSDKISAEEIRLSYSINPRVPNVLFGDSFLLGKVIIRLIENLVLFTDSGDIKINIDMKEENPKENVTLLIRLEEIGNSPLQYDMAEVLDEESIHKYRKSAEQEQLSLSLKLCRTMLAKLGGNLEGENYSNKSLWVNIILNQIVGSESELIREYEYASKTLGQTWRAPKSNVLVVDDTPTNLKLISGMIRLHGINPDNAESGKECLAKMESKKYDLVFLDYMMPSMNGADTLKHIKHKAAENDNFVAVPVIALSAKSLQRDRAKFVEMGFDDFISKPIDDKELEGFLRRYLSQNNE